MGYTNTKDYSLLLWNSNLTVCLVFYLAILVWRLNRRDKKTAKTSTYNWKKRNFHSYPYECFLSRYNSPWHWFIFDPPSCTNGSTAHTTSWYWRSPRVSALDHPSPEFRKRVPQTTWDLSPATKSCKYSSFNGRSPSNFFTSNLIFSKALKEFSLCSSHSEAI